MKKILSVLIGLSLTAAVSAFTWSGLVDNNTKISKNALPDMGISQSNGIYLSIATPLAGNLNFSAEGLYKYSYTKTGDVSNFTNIADVDLLKLGGAWKTSSGLINLSAGRFFISDAAGAVFAQTSDGLYLNYSVSSVTFGMYAGYTGLLNSLNVSMAVPNTNTNEQFYNLSAGYIPLSAEVSYGALFGTDTIGLQVMYFLDPVQDLPSVLYGTVSLSGAVSTIGTYSVSATLGSVKFDNLMLYAKGDLIFFASDSVIAGAGIEYASGAQGSLSSFSTVTAKTACNYAGGYSLSGVLLPKLSASYTGNGFYANLTEKFVSLMPEDKINFNGFDTSVTVLYNIFSDLQIGLDLNAYFDIKDTDMNYYAGTVKASLTF